VAARWSPSDDRLLGRLYAAGLARAELAARLGRSEYAVDARRRSLGVAARPGLRRWSELEDELVRAAAAAGVPATELAARIGRPADAVWRRRRRLGLASAGPRLYTPAEEEALRLAVEQGADLGQLAAAWGRSSAALALRARQLGLVSVRPRRRWLPEEDRLIREGYGRGLSCAAIGRLLSPPRSADAVAARARTLGLGNYGRRWTAAEDERLRNLLAAGVAPEQAAGSLVRTPEAVRQRTRALGLKLPPAHRPRARKRWSEREDAILRRRAAVDDGALALLLGRSDVAVRQRISALGLRERQQRSPHHPPVQTDGLTPAELRLLRSELAAAGPRRLYALARRLGRTPGELKRVAGEGVEQR
jgi:hypothetical protein